jgi:hypothetical protein
LVEVTEEWEIKQLRKHKMTYKQLRESELIETQREEAENGRKNDEIDRRNLQMRTEKQQSEIAQKQLISRMFVKEFMRSFKRDNLIVLVNIGTLRSHKNLSMEMDFLPHLIG